MVGGEQVCRMGEFSILPTSLKLFSSALAQTIPLPGNTERTFFSLLPSLSQTQKTIADPPSPKCPPVHSRTSYFSVLSI